MAVPVSRHRCSLRMHRNACWGGPSVAGYTIRMIGFEGRHQWRRNKAIQASCQARRTKISIYLQQVGRFTRSRSRNKTRIQNLRLAHFLCVAQKMSRRIARRPWSIGATRNGAVLAGQISSLVPIRRPWFPASSAAERYPRPVASGIRMSSSATARRSACRPA
jgi:hypothetical protein